MRKALWAFSTLELLENNVVALEQIWFGLDTNSTSRGFAVLAVAGASSTSTTGMIINDLSKAVITNANNTPTP